MSDYAANCAAHARVHADEAEKLVQKSAKNKLAEGTELGAALKTMHATRANAHATLALYWQKEAHR